jgi:hypothetical protein
VCVHRDECMRVCMNVFDCTVFHKKKIPVLGTEIDNTANYLYSSTEPSPSSRGGAHLVLLLLCEVVSSEGASPSSPTLARSLVFHGEGKSHSLPLLHALPPSVDRFSKYHVGSIYLMLMLERLD